MQGKKKTCFIYVRVSTKMQAEQGESIDAQLYELERYAKLNDMRVLGTYIDDGYSGKSITGRPHFQEMLEAIKSGTCVDYILVFKLSRFGRNAADSLNSLQLMQDYGTNLICVKDGINSEAQMGKMMIAFLAAFAEMERENIIVQTSAGREQKAREGKWNGGQAPFGYKLVKDEKGDGHLEIDEDEAEVVRLIFKMYTKTTKGSHVIARELNAKGYRKKVRGNGKYEFFAPGTIKNMLRNPVYAGLIAFGRRRMELVKGTRNEYKPVAQKNFDIYEGEHAAIIDMATWEATKERLARDSRPFPEPNPDAHVHLLTGMLRCPVCGRAMVSNVTPSKYIDKEVIELVKRAAHSEVFYERLREELDDSTDIEKLEADVERIRKAIANNEAARRMLSRKLDALDAGDKNYERKYEDMQERLDRLYDECGEMDDELYNAGTMLESAQENRFTTETVYEMLDEFQENFDGYDPQKQKEILCSIIDSIEIKPDANVKKGDFIVKRVTFKCPVSFYRGITEEMQEQLGIETFERLETTEYVREENSRDGQHTVESVCVLEKKQFNLKPTKKAQRQAQFRSSKMSKKKR